MVVKAPDALLAQLKFEPAATVPVSDTLRVAGRIDFDEQRLARIGSSVNGRVTDLYAQLGQSVNKGEVLARLHSNELSTAQLAYLKAKSQMELNRRNMERAQSLFATDVISDAELQRRTNEFEISSAETRAARDQLRVLGLPQSSIDQLGKSGAIDSVAPVISSIKGVVVERKVAAGQVVQPADNLFVIAELSRVWAVAQVPEQQVSQVKEGQSVQIEVPALANEKLVGKLIFVGQTINPDTRTVLVRTELDNRDGRLKPAMLASMLIESAPLERLVVPNSAVVRENDMDYVFIGQGDKQFRLTRVKLGPQSNGHRVVVDGIKTGDRIVVEGAFHLNNQRNNTEAE
ncbi:MAG: efflux RND transporter periplasmic adaptor subunit [Rhodocyclaceae bacterium]|nr:efflux RND transporter periplasmic adaptor subunit [Rhodocyclaceae bacterium]